MDNLLLVSNFLLWLLVFGLALIVVALARQIGVLYERVAPAGALMVNTRLETGAVAPKLDVKDINTGQNLTIGGGHDRSQLLFFLSPTCPVCKTLLPMLKSISSAESKWLDVIYASDGEEKDHREFIQRNALTDATYVSSELLGQHYGVAKLPFAVLIDEHGVVASLGLVNSREHFESLFESMERGVPSLQAYIAEAGAGVKQSPDQA